MKTLLIIAVRWTKSIRASSTQRVTNWGVVTFVGYTCQ